MAIIPTQPPTRKLEPLEIVILPPPMPTKFRVPFVLTCVNVETGPNAPTVLDCVVTDAVGQVVRARGHMRVNVSQSTNYEQAAAILQSWATSLSRDFLANGKAERVAAVSADERIKELRAIVEKPFVGASA